MRVCCCNQLHMKFISYIQKILINGNLILHIRWSTFNIKIIPSEYFNTKFYKILNIFSDTIYRLVCFFFNMILNEKFTQFPAHTGSCRNYMSLILLHNFLKFRLKKWDTFHASIKIRVIPRNRTKLTKSSMSNRIFCNQNKMIIRLVLISCFCKINFISKCDSKIRMSLSNLLRIFIYFHMSTKCLMISNRNTRKT